MRILGFSKRWQKLSQPTFTTFRYPRRDRDWEMLETVQVVFKPRSKEHEILGKAIIVQKELKDLDKLYDKFPSDKPGTCITKKEATEDGFQEFRGVGDVVAMRKYIRQPGRPSLINKLTLYWLEKEE